jgi:Tfp pilus assembly protein PilE
MNGLFYSLAARPASTPRIHRRRIRAAEAGTTLLELVVACSILLVLASVSIPLARVSIRRHREADLRYDLRQMTPRTRT